MTTHPRTKTAYTVAIETSKTPGEVFHHITHDVSKFWPEELEGKCSGLNDEFVFKSGETHYSKNRVVEWVPAEKVTWLVTESWRTPDNFDWTGTKMIFELIPKDGKTLLRFTYDGTIRENEYDRLVQVCDMVIKDNLHRLLATTMNKSYTATIEVAKPAADVFRSLQEPSKWWSKDVKGSSSKPGDEFVVRHSDVHYSKQQLTEVIPDKKIVWLVTESKLNWLKNDQYEWTGTKMIFDLIPQEDKTVLRFIHEGLLPEKECYSRCEQGWSTVIRDYLPRFISEGKTV
jgi:hypothetical protein